MRNFKLEVATKQKVFMKLGLAGPSGSGKTLGALMIAYGITGDWSKIAVLDTENRSASLYSKRQFGDANEGFVDVGEFMTINFPPPYNPESYIEAIEYAQSCGIQCLIIDSLSHEWIGEGGILSQLNTEKDKFGAWKTLTPRHDSLIDKIRHANMHIICCMRSKQEYEKVEEGNKTKIVKLGMGAITREGMDYEFTTVFDIDMEHRASASKDRTSLFIANNGYSKYSGSSNFKITPSVGKAILEWCSDGVDPLEEAEKEILVATTKQNLIDIYNKYVDRLGDSVAFKESLSKKRDVLAEKLQSPAS